MTEKIRFDGQVSIITGAGGSLGRLYSLELARLGAKVVVNDLGVAVDGTGKKSTSPADKIVNEIKSLGGEAVANYDDVSTVDGGKNIIKTALDSFGKVDILINNAGIYKPIKLLEMEPNDWDQVIAVHLRAAYCVTRPAVKHMIDNNYGRILMITSGTGIYGSSGGTCYGAAKMGVIGFTKSLKEELKSFNIKINSLAPLAASRMNKKLFDSAFLNTIKPEYVAPLALYLVSNDCQVSGEFFYAGQSSFARHAIFLGPVVKIGDGITPPNLKDIKINWEKMMQSEGSIELKSRLDSIRFLHFPNKN